MLTQKLLLGLCSILLTTTTINTQAQQSKGLGAIIGTVLTAEETPVEFATVSLHNSADSALVTGTITNEQGQYQLTEIPLGNYFLKAGFIGYEEQWIHDLEVSKSQPLLQLQPLVMNANATLLNEAEISAEKSVVETHIDKKVYNVSKDITAQGGDGLEALRKVPSVTVDQDGNISLRGNSNVRILVDGRPISVDPGMFFAQLPAGAIERIEVVTNPSAKYDPEGVSGIINVVLKKEQAAGFNGTITLTDQRNRMWRNSANLMLNYRKKKLNVSGMFAAFHGRGLHGGTTETQFVQGDSIFNQDSEDVNYWKNETYFSRVGIDYFLNDQNTFYFSGALRKMEQLDERNVMLDFHDDYGLTNSSTYRYTLGSQPNWHYNLNGGWQHTFQQPGHTFDVDVSHQATFYQLLEHYDTYQYDAEGVFYGDIGLRNSGFIDTTWITTIRTDYVLPINDSTSFEAGTMSRLDDVVTIFNAEYYDPLSAAYLPDTNLNNQFDFSQQTHAAYATFGQERGAFGFKLGLRLEQTITDARLVNTEETFRNEYLSLFPTAHFSKNWSKQRQVMLSYSRRINRPQLEILNPFPSYSDPYNRQVGNPFLKPEFIHVVELSYLQFWKKFNVNSTVYYRYINDMMRRFLTVNESTRISEVSFTNFSYGELMGLELIGTYSPTPTFRTTATLNAFQTRINPSEFDADYAYNTNSWTLQFTSMKQFKNGLGIQLNGNYQARMQVLQGVILPRYSIDAGVRYSFWNRKGSLAINCSDIFKTMQFTFESDGVPNYYNRSARWWQSRTLTVNFSYQFGSMGKGPQRRQTKTDDSGDNYAAPDLQ